MRKLMIAITAALAVVGTAPAASAAAFAPGSCPAGFQVWNVTAEPYRADNLADEDGNNNGWVCARAIGMPHPSGNQIYIFSDDSKGNS